MLTVMVGSGIEGISLGGGASGGVLRTFVLGSCAT